MALWRGPGNGIFGNTAASSCGEEISRPGIMSCVEPCIIVHGGATDIFRIFDTKQINQRILGVQEAAKVGYQIFLKAREQQWFIYLYPKECF